MNSIFKDLKCPDCGERYAANIIQTVCVNQSCLSSLFATYDKVSKTSNELLDEDNYSMWRYSAFLPVLNPKNIISMGEGFTPIIPLKNLKYKDNENNVFWKDESGNPTGSFKARGISAALSKAKELGITEVSIPTAGNAGGALAAYSARGNMQAHVFMPKDTPKVFKDECRLYGAKLTEIDGNISDCGKIAQALSIANNWFQISTLKEPYRLEGKKTMGYEIAEQFDWELPDVILYPTGGGTGLIGIWKAFNEMEEMGWLDSRRPRMVAVQSNSCNGITTAFLTNQEDSAAIDNGFTIANGLRVPKPYASKIILNVLRSSAGTAISINDVKIEAALKEIAKKEGMLIAPEGAALWEAYKQLVDSNWIMQNEKVLLLNTGTGYKYLENLKV
ncbi:MAG: threonine synthase [Sphingobacteriaceae bacterium]|nr:threonine synthase [Sphingobacteriaceae bacterium]